MKKLLTVLIVLLLCVSVCACGEKSKFSTPAVESLVNRIESLKEEPLSLELEAKIHTAELLLGNLTSELQEEVYNRDDLTQLRTQLELLKVKIESINKGIEEIKNGILPEDLPTLQKLKEDCDSLSESDLLHITDYATLERLLNEYDTWYGNTSDYQSIKDQIEDGNYTDALDIGKELLDSDIPSSFESGYGTVLGQALVQEAQRYSSEGNHQGVIDLYHEALMSILPDADKQAFLSILGDTYLSIAQTAADKGDLNEVCTILSTSKIRRIPADKLSAITTVKNDLLLKKTKSYYGKKDYASAVSLYEEHKSNIGGDSIIHEMREMAYNSYMAMAKKSLSNKKYYDALTYAKSAQNATTSVDLVSEAKEYQAEIIKKARPENGKVLERKIDSGYNEFVVHSSSSDALIKLESVDDPDEYILFFVHANSSAKIKVCNGKYLTKYVTGDDFIDKDNTFLVNASYSKADEVFEMNSYTSGGRIYYNTVSITLYTVVGGNMETEEISPNEF